MKKDPLKIALHFLKFRPRSVFEVEQKLKTKKISEGEIKKVITVLKRNKLLDDAEFAKMWVRDRNLLKPTGTFLLKLELRKLGLPAGDIENALADQDDESLARKAIEMKYRERDIEYEKKANFLMRRGFSTHIIYQVIKKQEGK